MTQAVKENTQSANSCNKISGYKTSSYAKVLVEKSSKCKSQEITTRRSNTTEIDLVEGIDQELDIVNFVKN